MLASYWNSAFTKICLGMKHDSKLNWIKMTYSGSSLYDVIADGRIRTNKLSRSKWLSLFSKAKLQPRCKKSGFNIKCAGFKARIGIIGNNEANCNSCDSWMGFGLWSGEKCRRTSSLTCGNAYMCPASAYKQIGVFGYILVK